MRVYVASFEWGQANRRFGCRELWGWGMWRLSLVVVLTTTLSSTAFAETPSTDAPSVPAGTVATAATPASEPAATPPASKPRGEMEPIDDFKPGDLKKAATKPSAPGAVQSSKSALNLRPDEPASFRCFVRDVMAFYDRTQVRCYNPVQGKIAFFAVDTAQPVAGTVITKALTGLQSGKPVMLTFAPTPDLNPPNCMPAACRRLIDIKN